MSAAQQIGDVEIPSRSDVPSAGSEAAAGIDIGRLKKEIFSGLRRKGLMEDLWREYVGVIKAHDVPSAENLVNLHKWLVYVFFADLVKHLVPAKDGRIIDWGGLFGHLTQILRNKGYDNTSNYILHKSAHYSFFQEKFGIPTLYGSDANVFNLKDGSVDVFISSGVFEHVMDDGIGREDLILKEIHRVLVPGGRFFIWNLPSSMSLSEILAAAANRISRNKRYVHQFKFTAEGIRKKLTDAGFRIDVLDKHGLFPGDLKNIIGKMATPVGIAEFDDRISHIFPFSIFANEWLVVARKQA
jgi:SAM-dependent methyltransferase